MCRCTHRPTRLGGFQPTSCTCGDPEATKAPSIPPEGFAVVTSGNCAGTPGSMTQSEFDTLRADLAYSEFTRLTQGWPQLPAETHAAKAAQNIDKLFTALGLHRPATPTR